MSGSFGVATDGQGNFYIANTCTSAILKFSSGYAGLGVTSLNEGPQAGADAVPVQGLGPSVPLVATSDQSWLNITGTAGGAISFSFQANTSVASRVAHIAVLGQQVTVTQSGDTPAAIAKTSGDGQSTSVGQTFPAALQVTVTDAAGSPVQGAAVNFQVQPGPTGAAATFNATPPMPILTDQNGNATAPALTANGIPGQFSVTASAGTLNVTFALLNSSYLLGTASVVVASGAGSGTVLLIATGPWTAASNAGWLQISAGSTSGMGNSIIRFSYAANNARYPDWHVDDRGFDLLSTFDPNTRSAANSRVAGVNQRFRKPPCNLSYPLACQPLGTLTPIIH